MGFEGHITPDRPRQERVLVAEMPLDEYNKIQEHLSVMLFDKYFPDKTTASAGEKMMYWITSGAAAIYGSLKSINPDNLEEIFDDVESKITKH